MSFADISLKTIQVVIAALNNDAPLMALVSGFYAQAPDNVVAPYVLVSPANLRNISSSGVVVAEILLQFDIWASGNGLLEAHNIAVRLHNVVNDNLNLTPYKLLDVRFIEQKINVQRRENLCVSRVAFRLIIEG